MQTYSRNIQIIAGLCLRNHRKTQPINSVFLALQYLPNVTKVVQPDTLRLLGSAKSDHSASCVHLDTDLR